MSRAEPAPRPSSTGSRGAQTAALVSLVGVALIGQLVALSLALGAAYVVVALVAHALAATALLALARVHLAERAFGPANTVTLARVALVALLAALLVGPPAPAVGWLVAGTTVLVSILDGVDGWLARRAGTASAFGARFDMEVDAALVLVLSLLAWHLDKAGVWVLASGLTRYGFVAAAWRWRWLAAPLPPSRRRQTVCVAQVLALGLCVVPLVPSPWSDLVAAAALAALVGSFAVDVRWLARAASASTPDATTIGGVSR